MTVLACGGDRMACLAAVLLALAGAARADSPADLIEDLTARGVRIESADSVRLPPPQMPDGLAPSEQRQALRAAAGKYPLDRFLRNAIVSPFTLDIESVDDPAGKRRGQRVDFCFVAYGTLAAIIEQDLFGDLAGAAEAGQKESAHTSARSLATEELTAQGLTPRKSAAREEYFLKVDIPILNRVQLRGVLFAVREKRPESVVAGISLDDRFRRPGALENSWSPIVRDAQGRSSIGPPTPYAGLGGYMKVTQLPEPADALFVECHLAFDEPQAWFDGKNLLRSKLPLVVQDNVRTFRRKLAEQTSGAGKK